MKPIRLEIVGFGPYAVPAVIDFEKLDPLFLIAGDTGAGKTSLFDAMCFALYGKPLGTREKEGLRSQHAADDAPTSVRLEWEVGGARWRVFRGPHVPRPKKRGAGYTIEDQTTLERRGADGIWEVFNLKPQQINHRIESEILGLSHEEFSKILVLPQGEFQRFLEMESKDRSGLLEKLFPTSLHKRIAELAKEGVAGIAGQLAAIEAEQTAIRKQFDPDTAEARQGALDEAIATATAAAAAARTEAESANSALNDAEALAKALKERVIAGEQLAKLAADEPRIAELRASLDRSHAAARCLPVAAKIADLDAQISQRTADWSRLAALVQTTASQRAEQTPALDALPAREAAVAAQIAERQAAGQRLEDLTTLKIARKRLADALAVRAGLTDSIAEYEQAERDLKQSLDDLDRVLLLRQEHQAVLRAAESRATALKALANDAARVAGWDATGADAAESEKQAAAAHVADAKKAEEAANRSYLKARKDREKDAAVLLATSLVDDTPCPVCGSPSHPHPISGQLALIDLREAVELAEAGLNNAREAHQARRAQAEALAEKHKAQKEHADECRARLVEAGFPDVAAYRTDATAADQALVDARTVDKGYEQQLKGRAKVGIDLATAAERRTAAAKRVTDADSAVTAARSAVETVVVRVGDLPDPDAALAATRASRDALNQAIDRENDAIRAVRAAAQKLDVALAEHTTGRDQAQRDVEARTIERGDAESALAEALVAEGFVDLDAARAAALAPTDAKKRDAEVRKWTTDRDRLDGQLQTLDAAIAGREAPELDGLRATAATANAARDAAIAALTTAERDRKDFVGHRSRWDTLRADHDRLRAESSGLVDLSRDLNGDNALRIDFSTFVLGAWLDHVLERGSRRLESLSDGRYRFRLHTEPADKRKRSGLDIDVWDAHTNGVRNVRTLSGGEKFLASLSLALGLSDVIQERSGGVELDTLFIDEGFGSLDPASLDRAMQVLDEIGQHRRVGVISHVDAMKKTIPCQIRVIKGPNGSIIRT